MPNTKNRAVRPVVIAALVVVAMTAAAKHVAAQRGGSEVRVAVVDSLRVPDARALVMREGAGNQPITIFLTPSSANLEVVGAALAIARGMRARPLAAGRTELIPVSGVLRRGTLSPAAEARLVGILRRLEEQPLVQIGNLGRGRWLEVAAQ